MENLKIYLEQIFDNEGMENLQDVANLKLAFKIALEVIEEFEKKNNIEIKI